MAEKAGKLGAVYAASGDGTAVNNEEVILVAGVKTLANTNVLVSKVTSDNGGATPITKAWYCTVAGSLTVVDGGTDTVYVTYKYWEEGDYGEDGEIGQVCGFFNWNADNVCDILETTDYCDTGIRTYIAGLKGWAGSAERHFLTEENLDWISKNLMIRLYVDEANNLRYEGWCVIDGHSVTSSVDTLVNESLSFKGDGILSIESS